MGEFRLRGGGASRGREREGEGGKEEEGGGEGEVGEGGRGEGHARLTSASPLPSRNCSILRERLSMAGLKVHSLCSLASSISVCSRTLRVVLYASVLRYRWAKSERSPGSSASPASHALAGSPPPGPQWSVASNAPAAVPPSPASSSSAPPACSHQRRTLITPLAFVACYLPATFTCIRF